MRIASNTASESVLVHLNKLSRRQSFLQTQAATNQRIFNPEDDPAAVGRILGLETERRQLVQFQSNATRALEISQSSYAGVQQMKSISDRAGELVTLGAGAASPDALKAYAKEVNQLIEQAVQLGNTKFRNDYLFAGTAVDTAPFDDSNRDADGNLLSVTYAGNTAQSTIQLSENSGIAPGTTTDTNTGMVQFVNDLIALRDALNSGDTTAISNVQADLETSENLLVNALSEHGAVELRIEVNRKQQEARAQNIESLVSKEADADLAETLVRLSQTATSYEAALSSGTKILTLSLLDYI